MSRGFLQLEWAFSVPRRISLSCVFMGASPHLPDATEVSFQKYSLPEDYLEPSLTILWILVSRPQSPPWTLATSTVSLASGPACVRDAASENQLLPSSGLVMAGLSLNNGPKCLALLTM